MYEAHCKETNGYLLLTCNCCIKCCTISILHGTRKTLKQVLWILTVINMNISFNFLNELRSLYLISG